MSIGLSICRIDNLSFLKEYISCGKLADDSDMELLMYEGSNRLMADFVNGNWNEEDFLIVQPGQTIQPSFDKTIVKAAD